MSAAGSDVTAGVYERTFVILELRWEEERDGDNGSWWGRDDTDRMVASVWRRWNGVDRWTWVAPVVPGRILALTAGLSVSSSR
jgi:hypothetical protein